MEFDINKYFNIQLTDHQLHVFMQLINFVEKSSERVFILKGYAGTGKTTLMSGFIKRLKEKRLPFELLASTGRAAKILSDKTGYLASTVHSHIYTFSGLDRDLEKMAEDDSNFSVDSSGQLSLVFDFKVCKNDDKTVYIIDESSMIADIADDSNSFAKFGSGKLLSDILSFDPNGKFIFLGDPVQLPPINQHFSPALSKPYFKEQFKLDSNVFELTEIKRIAGGELNGIQNFSMQLRRNYSSYNRNFDDKWVKFQVHGRQNINRLNNHATLINQFVDKIKKDGFSSATLICQTNRHCHEINTLVRNTFFFRNADLQIGDLLMITQNHYLTDLVNGDQVVVLGIGQFEYRCGLKFLNVELFSISSGKKYNTVLIENVINYSGTNITAKQHKDLFVDFFKRMKSFGIKQGTLAFNDHMKNDPYLNALRAVYGYALTCHKSQGGEWEEVYLYLDNKIQGYKRPEVYQWLYTAVTRTKNNLYLVDDWFIY